MVASVPTHSFVYDRGGMVILGYDADYYELSPVQFAVGDYCGYW